MDRREFLGTAGAAALLAATPGLAYSRVFDCPAAFDDYRALVSVNLVGGNLSFSMLVPRSVPENRAYKTSRRDLAIPYDGLLPIAVPGSGGRLFGIHSAMRSLQHLFRAGNAAFVANVGALVQPITRDDFFNKSVALPSRLFSHRSQQAIWGSITGTCPAQPGGARDRAIDKPSRPSFSTVFPQSQLGARLRAVARLIAAREESSARRQFFLVGAGGFDSHENQSALQPGLLADLSNSMAAFYQSTVDLGVAGNVTTFTDSDFGRTLTSNGSGTDHAWGGNQIVLGGAVLGGRVYGSYPELRAGGPEDVGGGRFIPSTSADQYAATLAAWFGMPGAGLDIVAPNLGNFAVRDLGFME
jgi:uncharacterized protein (DUF1501 family)